MNLPLDTKGVCVSSTQNLSKFILHDHFMKKIFTTLLGVFCIASALAIPAKRTPIKVQQPDGTELTVFLRGDEWFHFYTTADGIPVVKNDQGAYVYATAVNNTMVSAAPFHAGRMLAHDEEQRSVAEKEFLQSLDAPTLKKHIGTLAASRTAQRNRVRAQRSVQQRAAGKSTIGGSEVTVEGKKRGLIILVDFPDKKMRTSQSVFNDMANQVGYKDHGNYGSVHDYFYAQSYGKFDVSFDVVGTYTVSKNMAYYGGNDKDGNDLHPQELIAEACKLADKDVDYRNYDWNNDGAVDHVYVIYAGYAEAAGADANTVWPHQWYLSGAQPSLRMTLDGMVIDSYACSSELDGTSGNVPDGIGTMCHEFSHCLGLPDFYDTSGNDQSNVGMSGWSLMDYGCYNNGGRTPCAYTAYERAFAGWMTLTELKSPHAVKDMKCIADAPEAYVIYNDANRSECYILDNHQEKEWDSDAAASGLLITHVDYSDQAWADNVVNNDANRLRCTVMPADGLRTHNSLAGDLYPNASGNNALTDTSTPAAVLNTFNTKRKKLMGKPITNIVQADGLISFDFMGGLSTAIHSLTSPSPHPAVVYDLSGRRVQRADKGFYIVDGRKVLK